MQFYYRHIEVQAPDPDVPDSKPKIVEMEGSFDPEDIEVTMKLPDGRMVVILNNGHEEARDMPSLDPKGRKIVKRERVWVRSEIVLTPKDADRLRAFTTTEMYEKLEYFKDAEESKEEEEGTKVHITSPFKEEALDDLRKTVTNNENLATLGEPFESNV